MSGEGHRFHQPGGVGVNGPAPRSTVVRVIACRVTVCGRQGSSQRLRRTRAPTGLRHGRASPRPDRRPASSRQACERVELCGSARVVRRCARARPAMSKPPEKQQQRHTESADSEDEECWEAVNTCDEPREVLAEEAGDEG